MMVKLEDDDVRRREKRQTEAWAGGKLVKAMTIVMGGEPSGWYIDGQWKEGGNRLV